MLGMKYGKVDVGEITDDVMRKAVHSTEKINGSSENGRENKEESQWQGKEKNTQSNSAVNSF